MRVLHTVRASPGKPTYEVANDREERDDESAAQENMRVVAVT